MKKIIPYTPHFPSDRIPKSTVNMSETLSKSIKERLVLAKNALQEAKKKTKKEEVEDILPVEEVDPVASAITSVNAIISDMISSLGSDNPAIDTLLNASRELTKLKTDEVSQISEEEDEELDTVELEEVEDEDEELEDDDLEIDLELEDEDEEEEGALADPGSKKK